MYIITMNESIWVNLAHFKEGTYTFLENLYHINWYILQDKHFTESGW